MKIISALLAFLFLAGCSSTQKTIVPSTSAFYPSQQIFWSELQKLCGYAFEGTIVEAPANDTAFRGKALLMHVRTCATDEIRIPFMVGENRSRTWVLTRTAPGILLKHDHRHADGSADSVTQYGGLTPNGGSPTLQFFPADVYTATLLPAAATNVWWFELVPGKYLTYNLRRIGTDRLFSVRFDLSKPVAVPPAPWGWKDQVSQ